MYSMELGRSPVISSDTSGIWLKDDFAFACPSPAAPGGFLFFRHFHCKPSPGAEMLRGGKNGHIHANLRDDANSGKGLDT